MKSSASSIIMKKSQYFIFGVIPEGTMTSDKIGTDGASLSKKRRKIRQATAGGVDTNALCMEAGLRVRSKTWFLPHDICPSLGWKDLYKRCWQLPAGSLFQQPELSSAVVELARARWHTGYIGESPPRTSFHIQQGLGWRKLSLQGAFCVIKKTKQPMLPAKTASMFCFLTCLMGVSILNRM